jgi:hypothetical protein
MILLGVASAMMRVYSQKCEYVDPQDDDYTDNDEGVVQGLDLLSDLVSVSFEVGVADRGWEEGFAFGWHFGFMRLSSFLPIG